MKLAEILTGPETWCKGSYIGQRVCLMGAVMRINPFSHLGIKGRDFRCRERARLERLIGGQSVEAWNDDPVRTFEEVATVVDAYDRDRMLNP